jgi:stress-induced morphogen
MSNDSRKERIEYELRKALQPTHLIVNNESYMELGPHASEDEKRKRESRYSIIVSAQKLKEMSRAQSQRWINQLLKHEFMDGLEHLSIQIL